jgi:hypothetical protein
LCRALSEAVLKPVGVHCEVFVNAGILPAEVCERVGLVIAELVTNAARHAFNGPTGKVVRVELVRTSSSWHCIVSDNGTGIKVIESGAGSRVLNELIRPLGGRSAVRSGRTAHRWQSPGPCSGPNTVNVAVPKFETTHPERRSPCARVHAGTRLAMAIGESRSSTAS